MKSKLYDFMTTPVPVAAKFTAMRNKNGEVQSTKTTVYNICAWPFMSVAAGVLTCEVVRQIKKHKANKKAEKVQDDED